MFSFISTAASTLKTIHFEYDLEDRSIEILAHRCLCLFRRLCHSTCPHDSVSRKCSDRDDQDETQLPVWLLRRLMGSSHHINKGRMMVTIADNDNKTPALYREDPPHTDLKWMFPARVGISRRREGRSAFIRRKVYPLTYSFVISIPYQGSPGSRQLSLPHIMSGISI